MKHAHTGLPALTRRAILQGGCLFLLGASDSAQTALSTTSRARGKVRFGLLTDLHYADKAPAGTRHYRETPAKLQEAARQFKNDQPQFVVELGDLIDAADSVETELEYLKRINRDFTALPGDNHYVLGNHCVYTLTKKEFLSTVGKKSSYYSFDHNGIHFVILDACYRSDGKPYGRRNFEWTDPNIPDSQVDWLKADLQKATGQTIVFVHQRLDVQNHYGVKNASVIRKLLESSGKVTTVFQGHSHKNEVTEINGIHYCVHRAMIEGSGDENSGYSTVDVFEDGSIRLTGFRQQENYQW